MNVPLAGSIGVRPARRDCDVMVIGGGPGGAATAGLLAQRGLKAILVDKDRHPRFHIGESLLPQSMPILDELGLSDRVARIGVRKRGAEFISPTGDKEVVFEFARAMLGGPKHAYQVHRSEFDKLLFDRAGELGAVTMEGVRAEVLELEDGSASIRTTNEKGEVTEWMAQFLVDASGRSTLTSNALDQKSPDPRNTSAAIFGHFKGIPRREDDRSGNIRIHLTNPGWMWQIPLPEGVTSIGLVAPGDYMAGREAGVEAFFHAHCAQHPLMSDMLDKGELQGSLRATGNFSYRSKQASGPSHIKVGDAYGFLDPIFSTGVHLALLSAREAADLISSTTSGAKARRAALSEYDRTIKARYSYVSWFVYNIHDPTFREMVMNPRNILGCERAVISLLAGDFGRDWRIRSRIALFKFFRYMLSRAAPKGQQG